MTRTRTTISAARIVELASLAEAGELSGPPPEDERPGAGGLLLAAGAWAVNLACYPWCLAYAVALTPGARALDAFLDAQAPVADAVARRRASTSSEGATA